MAKLAAQYQTPLYVYSKQSIVDNFERFRSAFGARSHLICYAVKANSNLAILNALHQLGAGFDVVSMGELSRVLAAGGCAQRCVFSGVAKSVSDITRALELGIKCFNVESADELKRIRCVAKQLQIKAPVALRINPDIDAKTHPYISTGLKDNKFGIAIDEAKSLYRQYQADDFINICGVDCHIGSQITDIAPFLEALQKVVALTQQLIADGVKIKHLDFGGGIGICYQGEKTIDVADYISHMLAQTKTLDCQLIIEPGRAIVGEAGVLLTRVEYLKKNAQKAFAIVDAAMNDLLRPSLYQAYHEVLPVTKNQAGIKANWDVVGPICETADFLAKDRDLTLKQDDILALMNCGAYGFSMSSNYNSRPRAAEVLVSGKQHYLVRQRENEQILFNKECIIDN